MGKIVLFLSVLTGAAIFAIALIGTPSGSSVAARTVQPTLAAGCHIEEFAADEGYGVSRKITRTVCPALD